MLTDWRTAPIDERLRATLGFLEKLVYQPDAIGPDDARAVRAAGVSDAALADAIQVCVLFSMIVRLADAFEFAVGTDAEFAAGAKMLLRFGYRM